MKRASLSVGLACAARGAAVRGTRGGDDGKGVHTSLSVARALVNGGETHHRHIGLQRVLALAPLPLLRLSCRLVIGAVRPADGLGVITR